MRCEEVREALPAYSTREGAATLGIRRHLTTCADCRSELALYGSMLSELGGLRLVVQEPPASLERSLASIPSRQNRIDLVRTHVTRNKRAYLSGVAMAAAGAGAAALWRARRARPLPA